MEMARTMLKSMNIPGRYLGEAVRHAVYLLNRLPTRAMEERTPYEVWNGRKPHLGHLKVFGCLAHMKVTTPHLKKLDDRSKKVVYFGVEEGSKAHRLYDPQLNKIVVSRDVIFEEKVQWRWSDGEGSFGEFIVEENPGESSGFEPVGLTGGAGEFLQNQMQWNKAVRLVMSKLHKTKEKIQCRTAQFCLNLQHLWVCRALIKEKHQVMLQVVIQMKGHRNSEP